MRNVCTIPGYQPNWIRLIFSFLFFLVSVAVFAQKLTLSVAVSGSTVKITTTFDTSQPFLNDPNHEPAMETQNGETSFGFFYRIDSEPNTNSNALQNAGSYYWRGDISTINLSITKTITLPAGKYSIVAYRSRKSKPIKTLNLTGSSGGFNIFEVQTQNGPFEAVDMTVGPGISPIKLDHSWNVFMDNTAATPPTDHQIFNASTNMPGATPTKRWLFVTLSVNNANWNGPEIHLFYDPLIFAPGGVISDNKKENFPFTGGTSWLSMVDDSQSGRLRIQKGVLPVNPSGQTHVHFIFEVMDNVVSFPKEVQFSAKFENDNLVILNVPVKAAPHDPNNLSVDIKTICPCQPPKKLKYRIEFQNIGTGPVTNVHVVLKNTMGLDMKRLSVANSSLNTPHSGKTGKKQHLVTFSIGPSTRAGGVSVDPGTLDVYKFDMAGISLSGTNESPDVADEKTWDFIEFEVYTNKCLKEGTFIRPSARVYFETAGFLDTNIGETKISSAGGQIVNEVLVACPGLNTGCPGCISRPTEVEIKIKN